MRSLVERIRNRAYFLWENRIGEMWWNPASNWLQAEREEGLQSLTPGNGTQPAVDHSAVASSDDDYFFVDRTFYEEALGPVCRGRFVPHQLFQFPIELPFHVPLNDGFLSTCFHSASVGTTIVFQSYLVQETVTVGIDLAKPVTRESSRTRVELVFITDTPRDHRGNESVTQVFEQALGHLNYLLRSYAILSKDTSVYSLRREHLHFATMYRAVSLPDWTWDGLGGFLLNPPVPAKRRLTREQHEDIVCHARNLSHGRNPFAPTMEHVLNGIREFNEGFYRDAVVYSQTAIETFLNALLMQALLLEGKSASDAVALLEEVGFIKLVKREFHVRFAGKWNILDPSTEAGRWYEKTYRLRNRIVHGGYNPDVHEAREAIEAAVTFKDYVIALVDRAKVPYQGISALMHKQGPVWEQQ